MKSKKLLPLFALTLMIVKPEYSLAVVKFADERIERDIRHIYDRYPLIRKQVDLLSSSKLTFVIRYGHDNVQYDAIFETDGHNLFLTFRKTKEYAYSLAVCFAHEATHALQFQRGQIGFHQNKRGNWNAINIDLWDEAEAFKASLEVAGPADLCFGHLGTFKKKYESKGFEKAAKWLNCAYSKLPLEHKNNPDGANLELVSGYFSNNGCKLFCEAYNSRETSQWEVEIN